jgi:hypothetical protein
MRLSNTSEVWHIMKEWVIRSNPDFVNGHEYGATHDTYATMDKLRDELDEFHAKIRNLGAFPGRREPVK